VEGAAVARRFSLGVQWIELVQPTAGSDPARHLADRGEVPYEIALRSAGSAGILSVAATHGARIRLEGDIEL
jgi:hypothetical protein